LNGLSNINPAVRFATSSGIAHPRFAITALDLSRAIAASSSALASSAHTASLEVAARALVVG